jgi:hypothetical protein
MSPMPTDHLSIVMSDSRVWRSLRGLAAAWSAAWSTSRAADASRATLTTWRSWSDADRLRFGSIIVASAGVWHVALWMLLPRYITSGVPLMWLAIAGIAAAVAVWAEPVSVAWRNSAIRARVRGSWAEDSSTDDADDTDSEAFAGGAKRRGPNRGP